MRTRQFRVHNGKRLLSLCPATVYPSFSKIPLDIRVTAGSTARLECSAEGLPTPQIAWQKDGGNDFPAARERRMHKMPTDDVLFIIDVKAADSGVYSCTAQNLAGIITANATLTILGALVCIASIPPSHCLFSCSCFCFVFFSVGFETFLSRHTRLRTLYSGSLSFSESRSRGPVLFQICRTPHAKQYSRLRAVLSR